MKYINQNSAFIVQLSKDYMQEFNRKNRTHLPETLVTIGFSKLSGELIRVEPRDIRSGGVAWEKVRDDALSFGMDIISGRRRSAA